MKDFSYLFEAVYETTHLSREIFNKYMNWLKSNIPTLDEMDRITTLGTEYSKRDLKTLDKICSGITSSLNKAKYLQIDITDKIMPILNSFIKDNNYNKKDSVEDFKDKKFIVMLSSYCEYDLKKSNKDKFTTSFVDTKEYEILFKKKEPKIEETSKVIRITIYSNILLLRKERGKTNLRSDIKHELVHMLDFARFKKPTYVAKDNTKKFVNPYKNKNLIVGSNSYYLEPTEQSASIQSVVSDLMENKLNRISFSKMINSQEFLKRFAEKHHPGISKSNINTKENLKNWNRYVGELMSKIRDANQKIKITFRDKGKSYTEENLIPEKFGFLTILKENEK